MYDIKVMVMFKNHQYLINQVIMKNIINRSVGLRLELYYSSWEHIDGMQQWTEDYSCSPWSDFNQRGSWQENPGLPEGEDRREVCHCRTRKFPPTNPIPCLWQVEFHPVNFPVHLFDPLFESKYLTLSQLGRWGFLLGWIVSTRDSPVWLHLNQPYLHRPPLVIYLLLSRLKKKIFEDWPQPTQVRPGGLLRILQRQGISLWADSTYGLGWVSCHLHHRLTIWSWLIVLHDHVKFLHSSSLTRVVRFVDQYFST